MVADTLVVDTRKVYGPHESSNALNLTIEGQESIFWIKPGERKTPGTTTKLYLRKQQNPWKKMDEDQFITSVENVVPNPPFKISIESKSHKKVRDQNSFKDLKASSLKDYSWDQNDNIREFPIDLNNSDIGFVGSAVIAVLESHGITRKQISMNSKSVVIDDENYDLEKAIRLSGKEISLDTTSITIDEDGNIDSSTSSTRLTHSKSRISLHGIEIPSNLFPESWTMQKNQASLVWPLPVLLVVDICGSMDLDLNSSRTQILMGERWLKFEERFAYEIFSGIMKSVTTDYWEKLKELLLQSTENEIIIQVLGNLASE